VWATFVILRTIEGMVTVDIINFVALTFAFVKGHLPPVVFPRSRQERMYEDHHPIGITDNAPLRRQRSEWCTCLLVERSRHRRGSVSSNAKTAAISYYYSTTSALRSSIAGGTAATTTTTNAKRPTRLTTSTTVKKEMMDKTDVFIFDCDGVIWRVREGYYYFVCYFLYIARVLLGDVVVALEVSPTPSD